MMGRYPSAEEMLLRATEDAGLTDFGPGDFRDGLANLLESLEVDAALDLASDEEVLGAFHRRLVNRLEVEAWYADHPEIDDLPIEGPIDVNGLPRTGTTALANMLSLDPQFRCLRGWEQAQPCPPPVAGAEADDPRRIREAQVYAEVPPEIKAMHIYDLDATMEDTELLGMAFRGQQYTLPVFGYHARWRAADLRPAYEYHRRVLKLLQSCRPPNRWLFKAPHHMFHLVDLRTAYPLAKFIMTHRDPAKVVPSYASLVSTVFPPGTLDPLRLGPEISEHLRAGTERAMADRAVIGEDSFLDVHHAELVSDPMGVLERAYDFLELEFTSDMRSAVAAWVEKNRSGAHGTHRYTAEEFGLSTAQVHADYQPYIDRFGIEVSR